MNIPPSARIIALLALLFSPVQALAKAPPRIVTSIPPVYLLALEVTKDITKPELLVQGNASLHHYTLTPRDATALSKADIVFYIDDSALENFLAKPLKTLSASAVKVKLSEAKGMKLLPARNHAVWSQEGAHHHHHHARNDMHVWLSPENAKVILQDMAKQLGNIDPERKSLYQKNASDAGRRIDTFNQKIQSNLRPYKDSTFIVFHDAYQYFEHSYQLHSEGTLTLSSEIPLGAKTLDAITKVTREHHVACMFSEPQYDPKRMETIASLSGARVEVLDTLETTTLLPAEGYGALLNDISERMIACFKDASGRNHVR